MIRLQWGQRLKWAQPMSRPTKRAADKMIHKRLPAWMAKDRGREQTIMAISKKMTIKRLVIMASFHGTIGSVFLIYTISWIEETGKGV